MTGIIEPNLGLRDHKCLEARLRLEDAAIILVLRDGLEHTTVDAVSELAEQGERGAERGLLDCVIHLLLTIIGPPSTRPTMLEDRMEIVRRHLLTTQLAQFTQLTTEVTEAVAILVARDAHFAGDSPASCVASAELVLSLCGGAVRVALREWTAINPTDAAQAVEQLELRAISLAREVSVKLA